MGKPIAFLKQAIAGWIGQAYDGDTGEFLDATGEWSETKDSAIVTLFKDVKTKAVRSRKKIEKLERQLEAERKRLSQLLIVESEGIVVSESEKEGDERFMQKTPNYPYAKGDPRGPNPTAGLGDDRYW